jgi:hypothetical protein
MYERKVEDTYCLVTPTGRIDAENWDGFCQKAIGKSPANLSELLSGLGDQGWEFVSKEENSNNIFRGSTTLFKRQVPGTMGR